MVSDLLSRSLAEHERAKGLRKSGQKAQGLVVLATARDLRLQALSEDPDQSDPLWTADKVNGIKNAPHAEMMSWYSDMLPEA